MFALRANIANPRENVAISDNHVTWQHRQQFPGQFIMKYGLRITEWGFFTYVHMLTSVVPTYDWHWCSSSYNEPRKPRDMKQV